jgi:hypothetical protein
VLVTTRASGCRGAPAIDPTRRAGPSAAIDTCRIPDLGDQHDRSSEAAQPSLALLTALMKSRG